MYTAEEVRQALALLEGGGNYSQVARATGVSRSTLREWRIRGVRTRAVARRAGTCLLCASYRFPVPGATEFSYAYLRHASENVDEPSAFSRHWPCLFPQHGPGRKHERRIELEPWQREVLDRRPWRFLRGLIHSDGCRFINTIKHPKKTYRYPRYNFTNHSDDIRNLFCEYCDEVGVEWRRMNRWNISVARRESVALMDRHIGPKR